MKGYKIKIYPTELQKERLLQLMDLYRFVYNWALGLQYDNYKAGNKFIRFYDICKIFKDYRNDPSRDWLKQIPINTARHALMDANQAFINFFEHRTKYPVFKTKKRPNHSFTTRSDRVYFKDGYVRIEGFKYGEKILCKSNTIPKSNSTYYNTTISTNGIDFFISVNVETILPMEFHYENDPIGIDIGLKNLAVLSDGTVYKHPNLRRINRRIKKQNRKVAKDLRTRKAIAAEAKTKPERVQWSNGMIKRYRDFKKSLIRKANIINSSMHQITREIVNKHPSAIVIESLDVKEMMRKKFLSRYISDSCIYKFEEYLSYKCANENIPIIKADMYYPSSQLCSRCGSRYKIGAKRIYQCPNCGLEIDRDLNAAINLKKLAI